MSEPSDYEREQETAKGRAPNAVHLVTLNSIDGYAPPTAVLQVHVIGNTASLSICDYAEDYDTTTTTTRAEIWIDAQALMDALAIGNRSDARNAKRKWGTA